MSGGEYAPKDSRDVTLHPTEPGKPSGWREGGGDGDAPEDKMAPDDSRNVTGVTPAGTPPGTDSGWRGVEGQGKPGADAGSGQSRDAPVDTDVPENGAPPRAVPQDDEPFSAEEAAAAAAAARSHQE